MLWRGHSGDGCVLTSTLCKYDLRKGNLFVLSWAKVRRVMRGRISVATGFNHRKSPHRTICVAVYLTAAFDTVNHNVLLSNIARSRLPEATCRWLSNYIRGRQSVSSCRCESKDDPYWRSARSKLSPTLFSFYIVDMPWPTVPVRRICYADDITVCASGVKISDLEQNVNTFLTEMCCCLPRPGPSSSQSRFPLSR